MANALSDWPLRDLAVLALTQTVGWGTVSLLPVLATMIAGDLGLSLPAVFAGTSIMYVTMGLCAPAIGQALRSFGARRVMAAGSFGIGAGLTLLSLANGTVAFYAAFGMIGLSGAAFLTTSAYVHLNDLAQAKAKSLISLLMLTTGLATAVFWPLTAILEGPLGWRGVASLYALIMAVVVPVLVLTTLSAPSSQAKTDGAPAPRLRLTLVFWLLVAALSLNSFVTNGLESVLIEVLKSVGITATLAVTIGALAGVFKVGGRVLDLLGGKRSDGLSTAVIAGLLMPCGLIALSFGGASLLGIGLFLVFYGLGSGAFAVARATMPLVFYDRHQFASAASAIALPLNLINAAAPPTLALILTKTGAEGVLLFSVILSIAAWLLILSLRGFRPAPKAL